MSNDSEGSPDVNDDKRRRPSLTNLFGSTLGDAFSTMATTVGGRTARFSSAQSDEDEKPEEQGDVEPMVQQAWHQSSSDSAQTTNDSSTRRRQMEFDYSYSRHQPLTPGWESPWHPETRDGFSIEFGNYRYNNHGEGGYLPRTNTNRSSLKGRRMTHKNGMSVVQREKTKSSFMMIDWWKRFLLDNPFVPLLFRLINVAFTSSTLAIAIRLRLMLKAQGAEAAVGSSPLVAIIFSPFTLVHVGFQIWLEYFSRPIGLWEVSSKLFYTLIDVSTTIGLCEGCRLISKYLCSSYSSASGLQNWPFPSTTTLRRRWSAPHLTAHTLASLVFCRQEAIRVSTIQPPDHRFVRCKVPSLVSSLSAF
jgi:hypothetical protein